MKKTSKKHDETINLREKIEKIYSSLSQIEQNDKLLKEKVDICVSLQEKNQDFSNDIQKLAQELEESKKKLY